MTNITDIKCKKLWYSASPYSEVDYHKEANTLTQ